MKPNILVAIADDASHMSAYGHSFLHTPHFDGIAKEGVLFANAFTPNPKCAPSRASLLTGMYPWQLEEAGNHFGIFPSKFAVYTEILEEAGYAIGFTGKGWAPGDYLRGGFAKNPAGYEFNQRKLIPPENSGIHSCDYVANFKDFLNTRQEGQAFCFWYGCYEPHRPYVEGEGRRAGKTKEKIEVPSYLPNEDIVKEDLLDYAFEIEWFDSQLGRILRELDEIGELDHTIVIVTSDNGMAFPRVKGQMYEQDFHIPMAIQWKNGMEGGRVIDDLVSFVDIAPTILEAAKLKLHPQMEGKSLLPLLKSNKSGEVEGRNRAYMAKERHDVGTEDDVSYPVRCIRTEQYLYVRNIKPDLWPAGNPETGFTNVDPSPTKTLILSDPETIYYRLAFGKRPLEELYDIIKDPECMENLASIPEFRGVADELWEELKKKLIASNDPRLFGRGDEFDSYEYVGDKSHSWKAYKEGWFRSLS